MKSMLDRLFSNSRLKQQGFSSGRKRRTRKEDALRYALSEGLVVRISLFCLFAAMVSTLIAYGADSGALFVEPFQASVVVTLITLALLVQFYINLPKSFARNSRVLMMLVTILTQLLLIKLSLYLKIHSHDKGI
jgi:hypothetical protein